MSIKTLNLTGFAKYSQITLSVSQNSLTAGPYDIGSWEGGGTGGVVSITVDRTNLKVAPDSVRFGVDLSAATFDTQGPNRNEAYDARLHELIYLWNFDDTGTWNVPVNVLSAWKNRSVAKGPWVAHMFTTPRPRSLGTGNGYDVSVLIIEPSSGKTAAARVEIFVEDPDTAYAGASTICINPVGDNNFSQAPIGAKMININELRNTTPEWVAEGNPPTGVGQPRRWLFKRGCEFEFLLNLGAGGAVGPILLGAYGSGMHPVLNVPDETETALASLNVDMSYMGYGPEFGEALQDLRIQGLKFRSSFASTTEAPGIKKSGCLYSAIKVNKLLDLMIDDCRFSGYSGTTISFRNPSNLADDGQTMTSKKSNIHMNDSHITNFGGQYTFYTTKHTHPQSSAVITGSAIVQDPKTPANTLTRAPVRINEVGLTHIRGSEFFHTDHSQPCLKMIESATRDGLLVNIHSASLEGGLWPLAFTGNTTNDGGTVQRISAQNCIVDGLVIVGAYRTQAFIRARNTGLTVRNCLFIQPKNQFFSDGLNQFFLVSDAAAQAFDPLVVGAAPMAFYNNTFRMDRTTAENKDKDQDYIGADFLTDETGGKLTNIVNKNNVFHYPAQDTPFAGHMPVSENPLWTPRNIGKTDPETLFLDVRHATPLDAVKDTKPLTGSTALGAALNGDVSYMDITLQKRPEPPSMGAWEAD